MAGDIPPTNDDLERKLDQLKRAHDAGLIDAATYQAAAQALTGTIYAAQADSGAVAQGPGAQSVSGGALIHGDALADVLVNSVKIVTSKPDPAEERAWLAAYLNLVIDECQILKLESIDQGAAQPGRRPLQLADVYVGLDTALEVPADVKTLAQYFRHKREEPARETERERKMRRVPALEALAHHRRLVLLGIPGSGKSTLVAYVALNLAQACGGSDLALRALGPGWTHGPLLPIRVTLRQFAQTLAAKAQRKEEGTGEDLWAFIRAEIRRTGLAEQTAQLVEKVARLNGALFLLDGLDEASTPELRACVLQAVEKFAIANGETCRYLITARPYAWRGSVDPEEGVYQLASLDDAQIQAFVTSWYAAMLRLGWLQADDAARKRDRLLAARTRADLHKIVDNPLLLTLTARLNTNRGQLPEDRADLYDEIIKLMLERWNERIGADKALLEQLNIPRLKLSDVRAKFEEIAFDAHRATVGQAGTADIGEDALRRSFRALLDDSADKAELVIEYIEQRAGLLIGMGERAADGRAADGRAERQFTFPHRTFQEFLAACHLASQGDLNDLGVKLATQDAGHWKEALVFAARQAKADRGAALADAMIGSEAFDAERGDSATSGDFVRAVVAAEQLLEIGLPNLAGSKPRDAARKRVASWLCGGLQAFVQVPEAPGRAYMGDLLADLGDPRFDPERLHLPKDDMLGFVRIPADPGYVIGTRKKDAARVAKIIGVDVPEGEINDAPTPVHEFYLARYPVTVAQFRAFAEATQHKGVNPKALQERDNRPVRYVSWHDAMAYCDWLTEQIRTHAAFKASVVRELVRGGKWRVTLPSELEWEAVARGGLPDAVFSWGDSPNPKMANCAATGIKDTSAVGCFPPNGYGAFDLIGNVWEWTRSAYSTYPYKADDGREKRDARGGRVVRGGAFYSNVRHARCACRGSSLPDIGNYDVGFRVVVSPISL